jgi:hypothetical protein
MNLEVIKDAVTSKFARQILTTQKHSPKLLFAAGVAGVVGTVVLACRATLKVEGTLEDHENREKFLMSTDSKNDDEKAKELSKLKIKLILDLTKPYLLPAFLGAVSIASLTGSHVILEKRNGALLAGYAALDRAYKEYRQRVTAEYGVETDRKFAMGFGDKIVTEKLADGTTATKAVQTRKGAGGGSPYAVLFDEKSKHFSTEPGRNAHTLTMLQSQLNDKLRNKGFVYLNEVLETLDLPKQKAGQYVGWIYTRDEEANPGDNYISFGLWENDPNFVEDFLSGAHRMGVWLDPNVAGVIHDLIDWDSSR